MRGVGSSHQVHDPFYLLRAVLIDQRLDGFEGAHKSASFFAAGFTTITVCLLCGAFSASRFPEAAFTS